jgi:hypothetical protein
MPTISIKNKVISLVVIALLVLGVTNTILSITESSTMIVQDNMQALESARDMKKTQIESFFEKLFRHQKVGIFLLKKQSMNG